MEAKSAFETNLVVITLPNGNTAGLQDYIQMYTRNWEVYAKSHFCTAALFGCVHTTQIYSHPQHPNNYQRSSKLPESIWFLLLIMIWEQDCVLAHSRRLENSLSLMVQPYLHH